MALKSVAEARTMLQTLYRAAVEQRAQVSHMPHPCAVEQFGTSVYE